MLEIALELAPSTTRRTRTSPPSSSTTCSRSPPPWTPSGEHRTRCGTRRTASSTTSCGCPTARGSAQGALHGRPAAACATAVVRRSTLERFPASPRGSATSSTRNATSSIHLRPARPGVDGRRLLAAGGRAQAASSPRADARRERVLRPHGIRSLSSGTRSTRTSCSRRRRTSRRLRAGRVHGRGCSAATPTGAGRCGCRSTCCWCDALLQFYLYYGDDFTIECPTGSGERMTLYEVAEELAGAWHDVHARRDGSRPVFGGSELFQDDPHWGDNILFYEYFHGDNGAGIGACHQTGWTGVVARLAQMFAQHRRPHRAARAQSAVQRPLPAAAGPAAGQRRHRPEGPLTRRGGRGRLARSTRSRSVRLGSSSIGLGSTDGGLDEVSGLRSGPGAAAPGPAHPMRVGPVVESAGQLQPLVLPQPSQT